MPRTIKLRSHAHDDWVRSLEATYLDSQHYRTVIRGDDVDVLKPDGSPLLLLRSKVLAATVCRLAFPSLIEAARPSRNRGAAAGGSSYPIKADGSISNTNQSPEVLSGAIGFLDRPICRTTVFTAREIDDWMRIKPFIRDVDKVFRDNAPERYAAQMRAVRQTPEDFVIRGTAFTTVTVNRNFRTAAHKDEGDWPKGFGVMSVVSAGSYVGGYLVFPKYRVAVDMRARDVLLADVHEYHGNTPIIGDEGEFERVSTVMYYRSAMLNCPPESA